MIKVSDEFHKLAAAPVRPLDWDVAISFSKQRNPDTAWFQLNQSQLNGTDLLTSDMENPIQLWDTYEYSYLKERLIGASFTRSVEFPYNVQSCIADFDLNNYDRLFSYTEDENDNLSPIAKYILPKRPCRLYLGFKGGGLAPIFVGLTQGLPEYEGEMDEVAKFTAMDFLSEIGEMSLNEMVMMRNVRTDEVIVKILEQFGVDDSMYNLDPGLNVIPFVYFSTDKNAGNALRELVQAENGALWLDEQGIIRFQPRTSYVGKEPVMIFDETSIIKATPSRTTGIVNRVMITSEIREVQAFQTIFTGDNSNGFNNSDASQDPYRLPANSKTEVWVQFDDPIWTAETTIELDGSPDHSNFTAVDLGGNPVTKNITATGELFPESMKISFTNTNNFAVSVNFLQLFGEPAKQISGSPIEYEAVDDESVEVYGTQSLEISDNKCFGNYKNIDNYASDILRKYSKYSPILTVEVKGNPALQLQDIITLDFRNYGGDYQVVGEEIKFEDSKLSTTLTLTAIEVVSPFILDVSVLDGKDVLV